MALIAIAVAWSLVLGVGFWLSRPISGWWRWVFIGVLVVLLVAMTTPPDVIRAVKALVERILPMLESLEPGGGASVAVHVVLFALVAGLTAHLRRDLGLARLLPGLVALAAGIEGVQWFVDGRYASWGDVGTNVVGVGLGLLACWLVGWLAR